jgi:hypothetical protein
VLHVSLKWWVDIARLIQFLELSVLTPEVSGSRVND